MSKLDPAGGRHSPAFFSGQVTAERRFWRELHPPRTEGLCVVSGGCEECLPGYRIRRATFPYWAVEFVAGGSGSIQLRGVRHSLTPATVFAYGPGVPHTIVTDANQPMIKYFVDFAGREGARLLRRTGLPPGAIAQTSQPQEILAGFESLIRSGLRSTPFTADLCRAIVEQLLLKLGETLIPPGSVGSPSFETYRRALRHMETHYLSLVSLRQIAGECHVDPAHLCRLFRRFDRQSPYQRLVHLKMNRAAELLRVSGGKVSAIAEELGYPDPFNFSRVFKRVFGVSPTAFLGLQRK